MKLLFTTTIILMFACLGCYPSHSYYCVMADTNQRFAIFRDSQQIFGKLYNNGFLNFLAAASYRRSRNTVIVGAQLSNDSDTAKCFSLNDLKLVSSKGIDSLVWYSLSDNINTIMNKKSVENYCLKPYSRTMVTIQFRSVRKISYETFIDAFLTDTLTFGYRDNLSEVKLINGNFREPPVTKRRGWR
ncbi:MAG: hypothetical protein RL757_1559 [Bacteroidota bacterium]|jgi:hypothetical protein